MKTNKRYYNEKHTCSTAHPNVCGSAASLINQNNPFSSMNRNVISFRNVSVVCASVL